MWSTTSIKYKVFHNNLCKLGTGNSFITYNVTYTQRRRWPDQCYFTAQMAGNKIERSCTVYKQLLYVN